MTTIQSKEHSLNGIAGYGIDADPSARPGVPKEQGPSPKEGARQPVQQDTIIGITGRRLPGQRLTPVYGTAQPPRGFSGVLRRKAYAIPPHLKSHWMLLLAADRIDVLEHRPQRLAGMALVSVGLIAGGMVLKRKFG